MIILIGTLFILEFVLVFLIVAKYCNELDRKWDAIEKGEKINGMEEEIDE